MHMVPVETYRTDIDVITLLETIKNFQYKLLHHRVEQRLPIFYRQLDTIVTFRNIMVPMPSTFRNFDHTRKYGFRAAHEGNSALRQERRVFLPIL